MLEWHYWAMFQALKNADSPVLNGFEDKLFKLKGDASGESNGLSLELILMALI